MRVVAALALRPGRVRHNQTVSRTFVSCGRAFALAVLFALSACSTPQQPDAPWGHEAVVFYDELAVAYSANDYYGVLDFYAVDAFQEKWRGAIRGGLLIRDLLVWNSGDLGHEVLSTHLGSGGGVTVVRWETSGGLSAIASTIEDGHIAGETVFDHAAWLQRGLRVAPATVERYEDIYQSYALAHGARDLVLSQFVNSAPIEGPAVFLGPGDFGDDPMRAIGLFEIEDPTGCVYQVAVVWQLDVDGIVEEETYRQASGSGACPQDHRASGWWDGLDLPAPRDEIVTSLLITDGGSRVEIMNGTAALERLVTAGLERFSLTGLEEPMFDSVTFEPSRRCSERSGRLIQQGASRDVYLCFFETDLCPSDDGCTVPQLSVRSQVLHELAHAWLLDHVPPATQDLLLEAAGLEVWDDESVPWPLRGVEYSAEVMAWGLLDEPAPMVRIGRPPCEELARAFEILTGAAPQHSRHSCG